MKDQECLNCQKHKEVDDLCKIAIDFEDQWKGFNEVLDHFQKTLLGTPAAPYFATFVDNLLSL
jgi:hypothetical protein